MAHNEKGLFNSCSSRRNEIEREDEVRLIAYSIWEEDCPDGRDCEHWFRAEAIWEQQQKQKTKVFAARKKSQRP